MDPLVYPRERTLGAITLVLGLLVWLALLVGTFGILLLYLLMGFIGYCFAHSALIAWIKGTGVKLSPTQLPELNARFEACCARLGIAKPPEAYLLHGDGMFNAFATRFLGRDFVILLSDVVDAMEPQPDGINFYIGHELGHIRRKHLTGHFWRAPVLWLPLLGAAYARANAGFWGSFHEVVGGYPWLTKRVARAIDPAARLPERNPAAYLLGLFVPYAGRAGGGALGILVTVAVIGILAAVALPAYQDYQSRAVVAQAWANGAPVRLALAEYYREKEEIPESLEAAGLSETLSDGTALRLDSDTMVVEVQTARGTLLMEPAPAGDGLRWTCGAGEGLAEKALPASCK